MVKVTNPTLTQILLYCENKPIYTIPSTFLNYIQLELRKMGIKESLRDVKVIRMAIAPIEGHPLVALLLWQSDIISTTYYCFYPTDARARQIMEETKTRRKHGYLSI